jgi:hypothetical protein
MGRNDDDDREKVSWREIDRRRDRSRHFSSEGRSFQERTLRSDWAKKQHLREAEKFFQGRKGTEAYKAAHASLHEKYGTREFQGALDSFLRQFGLPEDWGTLLLVLDAQDSKWVAEALRALKVPYEKRSPLEQKGFKAKVQVLAMTTKERRMRQECETILEELA